MGGSCGGRKGQRGRGWRLGSPKQTEEFKYHQAKGIRSGWQVGVSESRSPSMGYVWSVGEVNMVDVRSKGDARRRVRSVEEEEV